MELTLSTSSSEDQAEIDTNQFEHLEPAYLGDLIADPTEGDKHVRKSLSTRLSPLPPADTLAEQTIQDLQAYFPLRGHKPSKEMWTALRAVAETLEAMADGTAPRSIHLSSLDPGVGKTTTVIFFLRRLLTSPRHEEVGVVVCVRRREQIEGIVKEAELDPYQFSVLTADKDLNSLGAASSDNARILFTTHSMIESRCSGGSFEGARAFHFRGRPRAVRIWDEAILPGQELTVSRDALGFLFAPLRGRQPTLTKAIEDLFNNIKAVEDGEQLCLPNLSSEHGVDVHQALDIVAGNRDQELAVETLWYLFGKCVTVRRDGALGETLLDYRDTLPDDIKPLLALDASARVRSVYGFWKTGRGGITTLPTAVKRYDALDLHVWNRGGGKRSFRKDGKLLAEGIASTILTRLHEPWLVIHHKGGIDMDFEEEVRSLLPADATVYFRNWGAHDATNEYGDVPNIILAGTLFYRLSRYEALGRLASGLHSSRGRFDDEAISKVTAGEHRHLILQALCRGAVRKCVGEGCPPTRAYIIASAGSGIRQELPDIFPGARILPWRPVKVALKGKVAEAMEFVRTELQRDPSTVVRFTAAERHLGWTQKGDFKKRIRRHPDFIAALAECGIEEWGRGKWPTGFRQIAQ